MQEVVMTFGCGWFLVNLWRDAITDPKLRSALCIGTEIICFVAILYFGGVLHR